MAKYFPVHLDPDNRIMVFVDGENLAIRYKNMIKGSTIPKHVHFVPDIYVWSGFLNMERRRYNVIRKYYYTSLTGDSKKLDEIEAEIKSLDIGAPMVFKKNKGKGSKQVDISLATDMLTHAHRGNYDVAVLVAGDEDYIPLVDAVMAEGRRVVLWFIDDGLSPKLKNKADFYFDMGEVLLNDDTKLLSQLY